MSTKENNTKTTPLMKQYNAIKKEHPKTLLLFRVGDFYETFGEDAIKTSKILEIVLTKRANGAASHIELAGFPHHALDTYLPKLVKAGLRVAVCDQLEDPKKTKGIVKRGVTELVTPGLSLNDNILESKKNNYLASLSREGNLIGVALLDISTGEFLISRGKKELIEQILHNFSPSIIEYTMEDDLTEFDTLNKHNIETMIAFMGNDKNSFLKLIEKRPNYVNLDAPLIFKRFYEERF